MALHPFVVEYAIPRAGSCEQARVKIPRTISVCNLDRKRDVTYGIGQGTVDLWQTVSQDVTP